MEILRALIGIFLLVVILPAGIIVTYRQLRYGRNWFLHDGFPSLWEYYGRGLRAIGRLFRKAGRKMKTVTIYTDGACSGNPGPGGWGAILQYGGYQRELSGGEARTTNNRMELMGVISALEALTEPCVVELWSDSKYVIDALQKGWAKGWRARGWVKPDRKPALNPDLWARLLELCEYHTVHLHWVKGHADNELNDRCDALAVAESRKFIK